MGKALGIKVAVSIIGIYSADGAYPLLKQILSLNKVLTNVYFHVVEKEKTNKVYFDTCCRCETVLSDFQRFDCMVCFKPYCLKCYAISLNKLAKSEKRNESFHCGDDVLEDNKTCSLVKILRVPPTHLTSPPPLPITNNKINLFV